MRGVCSDGCHSPESACADAWPAGATAANASLDACVAACRRCERCRFASFSKAEGVCVWQDVCRLLQLHGEDFETVEVRSAASTPPTERTGQRRSSAGLLDLSSALSRRREWLSPSMLDDGVTGARGDDRLACFLRSATTRPVVVAAFGGSVTAGLSYKVLNATEQRGGAYRHLYHRVLARWLRAQWPGTQRDATDVDRTVNLGVPGTGPTMTALCLSSMQPRPPDLALVEFGINTNTRDLPMFQLLLRTLRDARVATIVVNVDRFGSWERCGTAHCRTAAFLQHDGAGRRGEAWPSQVRAIEAISAELRTPVVNVNRAIGARLGAPPFVLSRFMRDCRHPGPLGHAWLAQLLVRALQQAAESPPPAAAPPACPAAAWPATAVCLRDERLRDAAVARSGFEYVPGRKPALRATATGSWVELRVRGISDKPATAQLGYLQSWMPKMGNAAVSCAPPCRCAALEPLDAYVPRERVSVTRLRAVRLSRMGGTGSCDLRITVLRGAKSGGELYVINSLILSSSSSHAMPALGAHQLVSLEEIINVAEGRPPHGVPRGT